MNELAEHLVDGLIENECSSGSTLTWAGATYPCSGGPAMAGKRLDLGGFKLRSDATIVIRTALLPSRPLAKQTLSFTAAKGAVARPLRIVTVTQLYDDVLVLECDDVNQAA